MGNGLKPLREACIGKAKLHTRGYCDGLETALQGVQPPRVHIVRCFEIRQTCVVVSTSGAPLRLLFCDYEVGVLSGSLDGTVFVLDQQLRSGGLFDSPHAAKEGTDSKPDCSFLTRVMVNRREQQ